VPTDGQRIELHREKTKPLSVLLTPIMHQCFDPYQRKSVKYVFVSGMKVSSVLFEKMVLAAILHIL
jgi:hypothetical protein